MNSLLYDKICLICKYTLARAAHFKPGSGAVAATSECYNQLTTLTLHTTFNKGIIVRLCYWKCTLWNK